MKTSDTSMFRRNAETAGAAAKLTKSKAVRDALYLCDAGLKAAADTIEEKDRIIARLMRGAAEQREIEADRACDDLNARNGRAG